MGSVQNSPWLQSAGVIGARSAGLSATAPFIDRNAISAHTKVFVRQIRYPPLLLAPPPFYPASPDNAARTSRYECDRNGAVPGGKRDSGSGMGEDVLGIPAVQIELGPRRQKVETCLRQRRTALARQHDIEAFAQAMQMKHVGGRVSQLRLAQGLRAPVAGLLLLGQIDIEQFAHQILQPVPVGVGTAKPGGDLGAVDRLRHYAESVVEGGEIETREVKDLGDSGIGQQRLQIRRSG